MAVSFLLSKHKTPRSHQIDFYFDYQGDFPAFDTWKIALLMIVFVDVHRSVTILNIIYQTSKTIKIYI